MDQDLDDRLQELARVPVLLVASDYDGTLAEIAPEPSRAFPRREALVALKSLAEQPHTRVAVISGRALADLAQRLGSPSQVMLVGSHGSEFDPGFAQALPRDLAALRARVLAEVYEIALRRDGALVEEKPAGVALHYRNVARGDVASLLAETADGPARRAGVHVRRGKEVVELSVVPTDKGAALETLRKRTGASATVFVGDDVTDEDAFAILHGPDLGIKIGPGETRAAARIDSPVEAARVLARLSELRRAWFAGSFAVPIERHSMLSDQRTAALVTPDARIVWWCSPRIDSPALFAELLGGAPAGRFVVAPAEAAESPSQRYVPGTLVLESRWSKLRVTDWLDCSAEAPRRRAGRSDLVRVLERRTGVSGTVDVDLEFAPRLDFGRVETLFEVREHGLEVKGTPDPIVLRSPGIRWRIETEGRHAVARARVALGAEPIVLELRYGTGSLSSSSRSEPERRRQTLDFWRGWSSTLTLPAESTEIVRTSALVLKGLCYGPTGGISAAATTSLPETIGGVRNWDYRYTWLRDAAMSAQALALLDSLQEGLQYLDWVLGVVETLDGPERRRPLYSVTGRPLGPEAELAELAGYAGSRPVRIGNAAAQQVQLDGFGPVAELMWMLVERGVSLTAEHGRLLEALVDAVARRWSEPDHGIWEIRGAARHHVHSKVMCWVTVDRARRILAHTLGAEREDWKRLADAIAADVLAHGWKPALETFTSAYELDELDAAVLQVGLSGLLAGDDPRFVATVAAVERGLLEGPTVYRYRFEDGLPGKEGGFHICASWLCDAYLLVGERRKARALFEEIRALVGPTGLLSEQYDPLERRALGNHPQAYSHIGLIQNALALDRAE